MTFDPFSFFLGVIAVIVITAINYGIVHTVQRRHQWDQILFHSRNPSNEYWLRSLSEEPPRTEIKESAVSKVISGRPSQS